MQLWGGSNGCNVVSGREDGVGWGVCMRRKMGRAIQHRGQLCMREEEGVRGETKEKEKM